MYVKDLVSLPFLTSISSASSPTANDIGVEGAENLLDSLQSNTTLRYLYLEGKYSTLSSALISYTPSHILSFCTGNERIGEGGSELFSKLLLLNNSLTYLSLSGTIRGMRNETVEECVGSRKGGSGNVP